MIQHNTDTTMAFGSCLSHLMAAIWVHSTISVSPSSKGTGIHWGAGPVKRCGKEGAEGRRRRRGTARGDRGAGRCGSAGRGGGGGADCGERSER